MSVLRHLGLEVYNKQRPDWSSTFHVIVSKVYPDSAAESAGVNVGDIVRRWNDFPVSSKQDLEQYVTKSKTGLVQMAVLRKGVAKGLGLPLTLSVQLPSFRPFPTSHTTTNHNNPPTAYYDQQTHHNNKHRQPSSSCTTSSKAMSTIFPASPSQALEQGGTTTTTAITEPDTALTSLLSPKSTIASLECEAEFKMIGKKMEQRLQPTPTSPVAVYTHMQPLSPRQPLPPNPKLTTQQPTTLTAPCSPHADANGGLLMYQHTYVDPISKVRNWLDNISLEVCCVGEELGNKGFGELGGNGFVAQVEAQTHFVAVSSTSHKPTQSPPEGRSRSLPITTTSKTNFTKKRQAAIPHKGSPAQAEGHKGNSGSSGTHTSTIRIISTGGSNVLNLSNGVLTAPKSVDNPTSPSTHDVTSPRLCTGEVLSVEVEDSSSGAVEVLSHMECAQRDEGNVDSATSGLEEMWTDLNTLFSPPDGDSSSKPLGKRFGGWRALAGAEASYSSTTPPPTQPPLIRGITTSKDQTAAPVSAGVVGELRHHHQPQDSSNKSCNNTNNVMHTMHTSQYIGSPISRTAHAHVEMEREHSSTQVSGQATILHSVPVGKPPTAKKLYQPLHYCQKEGDNDEEEVKQSDGGTRTKPNYSGSGVLCSTRVLCQRTVLQVTSAVAFGGMLTSQPNCGTHTNKHGMSAAAPLPDDDEDLLEPPPQQLQALQWVVEQQANLIQQAQNSNTNVVDYSLLSQLMAHNKVISQTVKRLQEVLC